MRDVNQTMRFNKVEMGLIKTLFADNENLLFTIRKVLLGFDLDAIEKGTLRWLSEEARALLKKTFMPELDPDSPIFQLSDMRVSLNSEFKAGKGVAEMTPLFESKKLQMDYLEQQLKVLDSADDGTVKKKIKLSDMPVLTKDGYDNFVRLSAWNYLLTYIDSYINELKLLAGRKDETPEETIKKLRKDSSK